MEARNAAKIVTAVQDCVSTFQSVKPGDISEETMGKFRGMLVATTPDVFNEISGHVRPCFAAYSGSGLQNMLFS